MSRTRLHSDPKAYRWQLEQEYLTRTLYFTDGKRWILKFENGGFGGAWDEQSFANNHGGDSAEEIEEHTAVGMLLEWGIDEDELPDCLEHWKPMAREEARKGEEDG